MNAKLKTFKVNTRNSNASSVIHHEPKWILTRNDEVLKAIVTSMPRTWTRTFQPGNQSEKVRAKRRSHRFRGSIFSRYEKNSAAIANEKGMEVQQLLNIRVDCRRRISSLSVRVARPPIVSFEQCRLIIGEGMATNRNNFEGHTKKNVWFNINFTLFLTSPSTRYPLITTEIQWENIKIITKYYKSSYRWAKQWVPKCFVQTNHV